MGTPARVPLDAAGTSHLPCTLQAAVSIVSTAQILRVSGYTAAEPVLLRALASPRSGRPSQRRRRSGKHGKRRRS
ncbi:hypothetical protein ABZP36_022459 [Zizania latifolia]